MLGEPIYLLINLMIWIYRINWANYCKSDGFIGLL